MIRKTRTIKPIFRLREEEIAAVDEEAEKNNRSRSMQIGAIVRQWLRARPAWRRNDRDS